MATDITRQLMYGLKPIRRTNPAFGQSEWFYMDPRGTDTFPDMKTIDVPNENTPNPYAKEIQKYIYDNDGYNYKQLYGDTQPPQINLSLPTLSSTNSYTTESAWGYPNTTQVTPYQLGTLSALMESEKGKKLWNNGELDKTGGWSYGTYQIATKDGTMNDYLKHLQNNPLYQGYYNTLQQAGGYNAALTGAEQFKNTWADLSKDQNFLQSQQDFIVEKKLKPTMNRVSDINGWNLDFRSPVVRDVLYSTATQHGEGGAPSLLHNRFGRNTDISSFSDEDIINNIYNERSNVNLYFRSSDEATRNNMKDRFIKENAKALELLKKYP